MRHETESTTVFKKITYTCDLNSAHVLLEGQKPWICYVCGREVCRDDVCSSPRLFDGREEHVCRICCDRGGGFLEELYQLQVQQEQAESAILGKWKEESLGK